MKTLTYFVSSLDLYVSRIELNDIIFLRCTCPRGGVFIYDGVYLCRVRYNDRLRVRFPGLVGDVLQASQLAVCEEELVQWRKIISFCLGARETTDGVGFGDTLQLPLEALKVFCDGRRNGTVDDQPSRDFPVDGVWAAAGRSRIKRRGDFYGEHLSGSKYRYELTYVAGEGDRDWMEECDINYLTRLDREGKLREQEPTVWYLREIDSAQERSIGEWWHEKLQLPDSELRQQLDMATLEYGQGVQNEQESVMRSCLTM